MKSRIWVWASVALAAAFISGLCSPALALQAGINFDVHQDIPCGPAAQNCPNDFHVEGLICSKNRPPMLMDHIDGLFTPPHGQFS